MKEGRIEYRVGGDVFILKEGDGLFINALGLHEAKPYEINLARIYCLNVDPMLLGGHEGSVFTEKYVKPYITSNRLPYVRLSGYLAQKVKEIAGILQMQNDFYELKVWRELVAIWEAMLTQSMLTVEMLEPTKIVQHERVKEMLDYLHVNYAEKIILEQLAAHVYLSREECSRLFKKNGGYVTIQLFITVSSS